MNAGMSSLFNERKAAQVAAYFLIRASERKASVTLLKLMKLMYLAERLSYQRYGDPIIGDSLVSMPHGPVLSRTLDLINFGSSSKEISEWDAMIAEKNNRYVALAEGGASSINQLRALSDSDLEILEETWKNFGKDSAQKLREYTHDPANCPEWQDPDGSSRPIELKRLFVALGYEDSAQEELIARIQQQAWLNSVFQA